MGSDRCTESIDQQTVKRNSTYTHTHTHTHTQTHTHTHKTQHGVGVVHYTNVHRVKILAVPKIKHTNHNRMEPSSGWGATFTPFLLVFGATLVLGATLGTDLAAASGVGATDAAGKKVELPDAFKARGEGETNGQTRGAAAEAGVVTFKRAPQASVRGPT